MHVEVGPVSVAKSVLVVEDEALIRTLVAEELEEAGYTVLEAESADSALAILEDATVDLVITDVRMPGRQTGLDVAAWVRKNRPLTRIVVMSGYVHDEVATVAAQFDAFVRKPFKPADLLDQARALMSAVQP